MPISYNHNSCAQAECCYEIGDLSTRALDYKIGHNLMGGICLAFTWYLLGNLI